MFRRSPFTATCGKALFRARLLTLPRVLVRPQRLSATVTGIPGGRTITNDDLRLVHAQLRAAAQTSNARANIRAEGEQSEGSERSAPVAAGAPPTYSLDGLPIAVATKAKASTSRKAPAAVAALKPPSNATTCAAAMETLCWFGLALGEPPKKDCGSSKGSLGRKATSFVDLEQLSACFDAHDAFKKNAGSAASSSDRDDPQTYGDSLGLDDAQLSNWDWVAAMSEAGLHDEEIHAAPSSTSGESAAELAHPLSSLTERPPQPADLLQGSTPHERASFEALERACGTKPKHGSDSPFDSEATSEAAHSERGGVPLESGRASPMPMISPMLSPSTPNKLAVSYDLSRSASYDTSMTEHVDLLEEDCQSRPSPYVSPKRAKTTGSRKVGQQASGASVAPPAPAPTHTHTRAPAAVAGAGVRKSRREHKPKTFLHEAVERPLLKWEKEQQESREGKKRAGSGSSSLPPPAAPPQVSVRAPAKSVKRVASHEAYPMCATAVYETDGELSPQKAAVTQATQAVMYNPLPAFLSSGMGTAGLAAATGLSAASLTAAGLGGVGAAGSISQQLAAVGLGGAGLTAASLSAAGLGAFARNWADDPLISASIGSASLGSSALGSGALGSSMLVSSSRGSSSLDGSILGTIGGSGSLSSLGSAFGSSALGSGALGSLGALGPLGGARDIAKGVPLDIPQLAATSLAKRQRL